MSLFPIIHDHANDPKAAERHCFALCQGGWVAKVTRPAGSGWQVHISAFRGFETTAPAPAAPVSVG